MFRNQFRVRFRSDTQGVPQGCGCSRSSIYEGGTEGRLRVLLVVPPLSELERRFGPYSSIYRAFLNFILEESPPIHFVICPVCCVEHTEFDPDCVVEFGAKCNVRRRKLHLPDLRIYDSQGNPESPGFDYGKFQKYSILFERFILKCGKVQKKDSLKV